jgi:hypothetical protein
VKDLVSRIRLADVLGELRNELTEAQESGAGRALRFEVEEAQLEFLVEISKEAAPGAKVKIDVVAIGGFELGADARLGSATTHRLALKLKVTDERTGRNAKVAAEQRQHWTD